MLPSEPSRPLRSRWWPLLALALLCSPAAHAAPGGYDIVLLDGQTLEGTGLAYTADGIRVVTPAGARLAPLSTVDWYATFYRNIKASATNIVVFKTGALLRFDRFELANGLITVTSAGGQVVLSESLIDFQASVREGAMVRLPEGTGLSVAISRPAERGWTDEAAPPEETAAVPQRRFPSSLASRRRAAAAQQPSAPDNAPVEDEYRPPEEIDQAAYGEDATGAPVSTRRPDGTPFGRPGQPASPNSPFGRRDRGGSPGDQGETSGQVVVSVSTDFVGMLTGVQLTLQYPPHLQLVEPVALSGFASGWLSQPNTNLPGQILIAGAIAEAAQVGGGEFLRVMFLWTGSPPQRQLFQITQLTATGDSGAMVSDFRAMLDIQIMP